ncbi:Arc family DNA-binding protein [Aeromonas veronii]|nr:Arc family DNA-binding protein [Aeromonas veronii]
MRPPTMWIENGRSMNSEIVQRLKEVLKNEGKLA